MRRPASRAGRCRVPHQRSVSSLATIGRRTCARRRFTCPEFGADKADKTVTETAPEGEVESWENEGGSTWGKDEDPWES